MLARLELSIGKIVNNNLKDTFLTTKIAQPNDKCMKNTNIL